MIRKYLTKLALETGVFTFFLFVLPLNNTAQAGDRKPPAAPLKSCWKYEATDLGRQKVASNGGQIFFSRDGGRVDALSRAGAREWTAELGGEAISGFIVNGAQVYIVTKPTGPDHEQKPSQIRSLSRETGVTNWIRSAPTADQIYLGISGELVIAVASHGMITAINKDSGNVVWVVRSSANLSTPAAISENEIKFGTDNRSIEVISSRTGESLLHRTTPEIPTAVWPDDGPTLIWGDARGNIFRVDRESGEVDWKFKGGGKISNIASSGEYILASSLDNFAYLISTADGKVRWKRRFSARVTDDPLITPDYAIILAFGERIASFIDLKTGKPVNSLSLEKENAFLQTPVIVDKQVVFPTSHGLISFGIDGCASK
ncbi:MAG: PQQ-binding-like beta-propeller repeat protein [Pyrinomonadaceae bacterium]